MQNPLTGYFVHQKKPKKPKRVLQDVVAGAAAYQLNQSMYAQQFPPLGANVVPVPAQQQGPAQSSAAGRPAGGSAGDGCTEPLDTYAWRESAYSRDVPRERRQMC